MPLRPREPQTIKGVNAELPLPTADDALLAPHRVMKRSGKARRRSQRCYPYTLPLLLLLILLATLPQKSHALNILLTNDDGIDQPGLQAMKAALEANNHTVFVFGPSVDKSGLSASVQLSVAFEDRGQNTVLVEGPPATCVVAGLSLMASPPDLIVVGISDGFATGSQMLHSSSVGAAMTGLARGIPTVTVAGIPTLPDVSLEDYFGIVARFTVQLIEAWILAQPLDELPPGYGLKVTYPPLLPKDVRGVALAVNGDTPPLSDGMPVSLGYLPVPNNPTIFQIAPVPTDDILVQIDRTSESVLVAGGQISVLPISHRVFLPAREFNVRFVLTLQRLVRTLTVENRDSLVDGPFGTTGFASGAVASSDATTVVVHANKEELPTPDSTTTHDSWGTIVTTPSPATAGPTTSVPTEPPVTTVPTRAPTDSPTFEPSEAPTTEVPSTNPVSNANVVLTLPPAMLGTTNNNNNNNIVNNKNGAVTENGSSSSASVTVSLPSSP